MNSDLPFDEEMPHLANIAFDTQSRGESRLQSCRVGYFWNNVVWLFNPVLVRAIIKDEFARSIAETVLVGGDVSIVGNGVLQVLPTG